MDEILKIVDDEELAKEWFRNNPTIHYLDGKPYGLVAFVDNGLDSVFVASTTVDSEFPFIYSMLKEIMDMNKEKQIVVITDVYEAQEKIMEALTPHGYRFHIEEGILYSIKDKRS